MGAGHEQDRFLKRQSEDELLAARRNGLPQILSAVVAAKSGSCVSAVEPAGDECRHSVVRDRPGRRRPGSLSASRCQTSARLDPSEPAIIALDQDTWKLLVDVNERVNAKILPVTDQDHWGVADRWDYPDDGMGDCEDIQLLKRRMLIEAGCRGGPCG